MNDKISLKHGYTFHFNEDGTFSLKVETADDILDLDGKNGILMAASDFESWFNEEDEELTVAELKDGAFSFLTDWGVDTETATDIIEHLGSWFEGYAIEDPQPDAWLKVLEDRVEELKKKEERHRNAIPEAVERFREWVSTADEYSIIDDAEFRTKKITEVRETYRAVWNELKKAESELWNYKETMHIR